jgi:hypothetical protein
VVGAGLDPAVELTVYRVVQEAVSNAVRHAPGAVVEVSVRRIGGELVVSVVNGPVAVGRGGTVAPGSGHGLVGMRERVGLLDGRVHTAPTSDGGYLVEVALPLDDQPAEEPVALPLDDQRAEEPVALPLDDQTAEEPVALPLDDQTAEEPVALSLDDRTAEGPGDGEGVG